MRACVKLPLVFALLSTLSLAGNASGLPEESLDGVWSGTLGKTAIVVCFEPSGHGTYYYLRLGFDLALESVKPKAGSHAFNEKADDEITGTWSLDEARGGLVSGTWSTPDGKKQLPLSLKRSGSLTEGGCPAPAYETARLEAVVRTPGAETKTSGRAWRAVTVGKGAVKSVELTDPGASAALKQAVAAVTTAHLKSFFSCGSGPHRSFASEDRILAWTSTFLVLSLHESYFCGGAYPDEVDGAHTFDVITGKELDTDKWFKTAPTDLATRQYKPPFDQCATDDLNWVSHPSPAGMVFRQDLPHVARACDVEVVIPWSKLKSRLTREGLEAIKEF
jgi:hypothetical protein